MSQHKYKDAYNEGYEKGKKTAFDGWVQQCYDELTPKEQIELLLKWGADLPHKEWIPVTERLPDSAGVYIVSRWFSDGCDSAILTDACYFDGTDTWHNDNRINHGREYVDKKIVAWMPLPEPYKESEDT